VLAVRGARDVLNPQTHEITSRSLLSTARLKRAKSLLASASCKRVRIAQTCFGCNGGFCPVNLPLFEARRVKERHPESYAWFFLLFLRRKIVHIRRGTR